MPGVKTTYNKIYDFCAHGFIFAVNPPVYRGASAAFALRARKCAPNTTASIRGDELGQEQMFSSITQGDLPQRCHKPKGSWK